MAVAFDTQSTLGLRLTGRYLGMAERTITPKSDQTWKEFRVLELELHDGKHSRQVSVGREKAIEMGLIDEKGQTAVDFGENVSIDVYVTNTGRFRAV
jgi:hypothetical protein